MIKKPRDLVYFAHLLETPSVRWYTKAYRVQQLIKLSPLHDQVSLKPISQWTVGGICTYYNKNDLPVEYTLKTLLSFKYIASHKKTEAQRSYLHNSQTYFHSSVILSFFLMHVLPSPHRCFLLLHCFYPKWLDMVSSPFNKENSKRAYFYLEIISTLFPKCLSPYTPWTCINANVCRKCCDVDYRLLPLVCLRKCIYITGLTNFKPHYHVRK